MAGPQFAILRQGLNGCMAYKTALVQSVARRQARPVTGRTQSLRLTADVDDRPTSPMSNGLAPAFDEAERAQSRYRRALRHSAVVRWMKVVLPMLAVLIVAGFVGTSLLKSALPDNLLIDGTFFENGKLAMSNPVLTGQTRDGQLYRLSAVKATQSLARPSIIGLKKLVADLPVGADDAVTVDAERAFFNRNKERIIFDAPFAVTTRSGLTASIQSAAFDIESGQFVSNAPVAVDSPGLHIAAKSMHMRDNGRIVVFKDRVRMTIEPQKLRHNDKAM